MKQILVSGIQPTGKLHLGNYLGALRHFVELQNFGKYECLFFVADYHSMTENYEPEKKPDQIIDLVLNYLSVGINPNKSTVFLQSDIAEHTELAWILNTITPFGELSRMTQFKDKSKTEPDNINVGLFSYPVLMAADILLYNASVVPVGEDQLQHLELTRTLARRFNSKFGNVFIEPKALMTETNRIMSLDDPFKKMSKSNPNGCIFLDDNQDEIRKKIKTAVTDSGSEVKYEEKQKPEISNLISLYSAITKKPIKEIELKYKDKGYSEFKSDLAENIVDFLKPIQEKKNKFTYKNAKKVLEKGKKRANQIAKKRIIEIKKKIGVLVQ